MSQPNSPGPHNQFQNAAETEVNLPAQDKHVRTIFTLSDEFVYMFEACLSSDVLHILKDNWHHYSQWIDGAHMSWQVPEFLASSGQLKDRVGSCKVVSASGTVPLRETVLPAIDRQLDQGVPIPAVEIMNPQHTDWKLLGSFGVILLPDVRYYLRCLVAISAQGHTDIDHVAYIYERIQSFYRENEAMLQYVFCLYYELAGAKQGSARLFLRQT